MGQTLEAILKYKQQKDAEATADISQIPNALAAFGAGQQQNFDNQIKALQVQALISKTQGVLPQLQAADLLGKIQSRQTQQNLLQKFISGDGGKSNAILKSMTVGGATFENPAAAEASEERKVTTAARKNLDEYSTNAVQVLDALDRIEKQSEDLGDFKRGVLPQAIAQGEAAAKEFGKDEKYVRYQGTVQRELIPLARKVAEEKGPISEFDVQRLEKAFGSVTTPLEDKRFLINEVRGKLKEALTLKKSVAKLSDEEFNKKYSSLVKKMTAQEKKAAALPEGVTEDDIVYTMKKRGLSRDEVIKRLKNA